MTWELLRLGLGTGGSTEEKEPLERFHIPRGSWGSVALYVHGSIGDGRTCLLCVALCDRRLWGATGLRFAFIKGKNVSSVSWGEDEGCI